MGALSRPTSREALKVQLAAIRGHEPASSYFELRPLTREGRPAARERAFVPVRELDSATAAVSALSPRLNLYIGAAPRVRQDGTAAAVERVWTLWSDLDGREALHRLRDFHPLPSLVIRSGSPDSAHAYWPLREAIAPELAQRLNRRLALALAGDMAATDPARILRPAGSLNHKTTPPVEVLCTRCELEVFDWAAVAGDLPDSSHYRPRPVPARRSTGSPEGALGGVARVVREAPVGLRNHLLNWGAFTLAPRVAAGEIDEQLVRSELRQAASAAGLGEFEIERTIDSGLRAGISKAAA